MTRSVSPGSVVVSEACFRSDEPYDIIQSNISFINALFAEYLNEAEVTAALSEDAFRSYYVDYYLTEMNNGGFSQFVFNSRWSPQCVSYVREGLRAIGAVRHLDVFEEGVRLIEQFGPDRLKVYLASEYFGDNLDRDKLNAPNDLFFKLKKEGEDLLTLNAAWLRKHPRLVVLNGEQMKEEVRRLGQTVLDREARVAAALEKEPRYMKLIRALCKQAGHEFLQVSAGDPTRIHNSVQTVAWHFFTNQGHFHMVDTGRKAIMFREDSTTDCVFEIQVPEEPGTADPTEKDDGSGATARGEEDATVRRQAIMAHVEKYIGKIDRVITYVIDQDRQIEILVVPPSPGRDFQYLITCGMSVYETRPENPEMPRRMEMTICLPPDWKLTDSSREQQECNWPLTLLAKLAYGAMKGRCFGVGSCIPNSNDQPPEPFCPETDYCATLIGNPTLAKSEDFDRCNMPDGTYVRFYCAAPLLLEEYYFQLHESTEALFQLLVRTGLREYVHPRRETAVPPKLREKMRHLPRDLMGPWDGMLDDLRGKFGPAPRSFGLFGFGISNYLLPACKDLTRDLALYAVYEQQRRLLTHGRVVWGMVIAANSELEEPKGEDRMGVVLVGVHPIFENRLDLLAKGAHSFASKETTVGDRTVPFWTLLGLHLLKGVPVPSDPKGTRLKTCPVLFVRKHLPLGYLSGGPIPLLIHPDGEGAVMVLPCEFWTPELLKWWNPEFTRGQFPWMSEGTS